MFSLSFIFIEYSPFIFDFEFFITLFEMLSKISRLTSSGLPVFASVIIPLIVTKGFKL